MRVPRLGMRALRRWPSHAANAAFKSPPKSKMKATSYAPRNDHDADNLTDTPVAV